MTSLESHRYQVLVVQGENALANIASSDYNTCPCSPMGQELPLSASKVLTDRAVKKSKRSISPAERYLLVLIILIGIV